jgi:hypothetical protein
MLLQQIAEMTGGLKNNEQIIKSITLIIGFRDELPASIQEQINPYINGMILPSILTKLKAVGNSAMVTYLEAKMK